MDKYRNYALFACSFLYLWGVMPNTSEKLRLKLRTDEKPEASAISSIERASGMSRQVWA